MNRQLVGLVLGSAIVAVSAGALADAGFFVRAKVVRAEPVYETRQSAYPEERCWNEQVRRGGGTGSYTPTIAGAILGGVAGNQFSKGKRRDALTLAGALLGASIGHDYTRRGPGRSYVTTERRCEQVERYREEKHLLGYDVTYRYRGRLFTTRSSSHPGKNIQVRVQVEPVQDYAYSSHSRWSEENRWEN